MNEAETRAEHIDPALRAAGWGVVEGSRILRKQGITPDDAVADLGGTAQIRAMFAGFQKYLYLGEQGSSRAVT